MQKLISLCVLHIQKYQHNHIHVHRIQKFVFFFFLINGVHVGVWALHSNIFLNIFAISNHVNCHSPFTIPYMLGFHWYVQHFIISSFGHMLRWDFLYSYATIDYGYCCIVYNCRRIRVYLVKTIAGHAYLSRLYNIQIL